MSGPHEFDGSGARATELARPFCYLSVAGEGEDAGEEAGEPPTLPATRLAALAVAFAPCSTPRAVALAPRSIPLAAAFAPRSTPPAAAFTPRSTPLAAAFAPRATAFPTLSTTPGAVLVVDSAGSSEAASAWPSRMNTEASATAVLRIVFMEVLASLVFAITP